MSVSHPWIILFDIDGTLLTVDGTFNRPLLRNIIDELNIHYPEMENDSFSGRTDFDILTSFLKNHEYDETLLLDFKMRYIEKLEQEIKEEYVFRHEYVDEAIDFFSKPGFINALLTGNLPEAASIKLKTASIHHEFAFGAFGEHHKDRNELPLLALSSVKEMLEIEPDPQKFIVIGDTPRDIECAQSAGMRSVAVSTGSYSKEQLAEHDPDIVIENLSNPEEWFYELTGDRISNDE